jgi:hypothetical protein
MLSLAILLGSFSRFHNQEKHNAFVKILFDGFNTYNCTKYQSQIYKMLINNTNLSQTFFEINDNGLIINYKLFCTRTQNAITPPSPDV